MSPAYQVALALYRTNQEHTLGPVEMLDGHPGRWTSHCMTHEKRQSAQFGKALGGAGDRPIRIVDIEASNFGGWPIEVAIGDPIEGTIWSSLIRPHPAWDLARWSAQAQLIHGITPAMLERDGRAAAEVAEEVHQRLLLNWVISDNTGYDGPWMQMLMHVAGLHGPPMHDALEWIRVVVGVDTAAIDRAAQQNRTEWRNLRRRVHRAAADVAKGIHYFRVAIGLPGDGEYLERYAPSRVLTNDEQRRITDKRASPVTVWREHVGLSINELAARAYAMAEDIAALEDGQRPVRDDLIFEVAAALAIPIRELL